MRTKVMVPVGAIVPVLADASRRLLLFAGLAAAIFPGHRLAAQEPNPLTKRVLVEMPQAYEHYREYSLKLQGTAKLVERLHSKKTGKRQQNIRHYEVKGNKDCASWMFQFLGEARFDGELIAINPKYAFHLKRNRREADWFLVALDPNGDGRSFRGEPVRAHTERLLTAGYQVYGIALPELTNSKDHKLQKVTAVQRGGVEAVQLDFDSSHPVNRLPFSPVQGGTVLLDPSRNWCILEYRLRAEWGDGKGSITETRTYRSSDEGMPIPVTAKLVIRNESDPLLGSETLLEYDFHKSSRLPGDEEFTLSAYGLPEPPGLEWQRPTPWYLWLGLAGIVCLVSGVGFRWLRRRKAGSA